MLSRAAKVVPEAEIVFDKEVQLLLVVPVSANTIKQNLRSLFEKFNAIANKINHEVPTTCVQ